MPLGLGLRRQLAVRLNRLVNRCHDRDQRIAGEVIAPRVHVDGQVAGAFELLLEAGQKERLPGPPLCIEVEDVGARLSPVSKLTAAVAQERRKELGVVSTPEMVVVPNLIQIRHSPCPFGSGLQPTADAQRLSPTRYRRGKQLSPTVASPDPPEPSSAVPVVNGGTDGLDYLLAAARIVNYSLPMFEVRRTREFIAWLDGLRDERAQRRIASRLLRVEGGNLGDHKLFDGIGELRIDYGPGYRVYFVRREAVVIVLLCGGDKSSQDRDIKRAIAMAKEV